MDSFIVCLALGIVIATYFKSNPLNHKSDFIWRRFVNWFPLGMTYAFLYMARYNLNVSKNALGDLMTKEDFGIIFGIGTATYGLSFLLNGPLVDKWGGKKGIIVAAVGSCVANILLGVATYLFMHQRLQGHMVMVFSALLRRIPRFPAGPRPDSIDVRLSRVKKVCSAHAKNGNPNRLCRS